VGGSGVALYAALHVKWCGKASGGARKIIIPQQQPQQQRRRRQDQQQEQEQQRTCKTRRRAGCTLHRPCTRSSGALCGQPATPRSRTPTYWQRSCRCTSWKNSNNKKSPRITRNERTHGCGVDGGGGTVVGGRSRAGIKDGLLERRQPRCRYQCSGLGLASSLRFDAGLSLSVSNHLDQSLYIFLLLQRTLCPSWPWQIELGYRTCHR
jgi:hypothetical protein